MFKSLENPLWGTDSIGYDSENGKEQFETDDIFVSFNVGFDCELEKSQQTVILKTLAERAYEEAMAKSLLTQELIDDFAEGDF